ncbi:MAG: phospholipid carrier-dependent glycosyltransferase, partial [Actinomycetota bacterium]|nr:phospholipid carrier-dependent glycosyltransferase [Actinomycetota bacterium]
MARNRGETTRQTKALDHSDGVVESSNPTPEESGNGGNGSGERQGMRGALRQTWSAGDTLALFLITLGAGVLRLFRVADPKGFIFDEVYYAKDACKYALGAVGSCRFDGVQNEVHPPLGKWLVSLGIKVFGFDETGFRIMVVVGGTLTVALLYLLGRALLDSTLGASLAAALLAIDPLHFVQSRTSMLDVFVPMFGVAAFLFLAYDRNSLIWSADGSRGGLFRRPWRLAAGIAAGGAVATKWSGVSMVAAVIVLSFVWEWSARTRVKQKRGGAVLGTIRQEVPSIVLYCVVVPIAVYVVSYTGVHDITGLNEKPKRIEGNVLALPWS